MSFVRRLLSSITGIVLIVVSITALIMGRDGLFLAEMILWIYFLCWALKAIFQYIFLARFMVDGRQILISGLLRLGLAALTAGIIFLPSEFMMLYMIVVIGASSVLSLFRAFDIRNAAADHWKSPMIVGVIGIVLCIIALVRIDDVEFCVLLLSITLLIDGVSNIITAFRSEKADFNV